MIKIKQLIYLLFISLIAGLIISCQSEYKQHTFRGICVDDPAGTEGLYNPERGFRLEVALDITEKNYVWAPDKYPDITSYLEEESMKYASDSVSLVQTYFYLTGAVGKDITEEDFNTMNIFFDKLRELGKKAVLRFAYETQFMGRAATGPTLEDIVRHTEQLTPFLEANKDVIQVVQAGMIGAWGEWHSSVHGLEGSEETKRTVLQHICRMTPEGRAIQIRVPEYKNLLDSSSADYKRVSFHDDFIVINKHKWDGDMSEGTLAFEQIVRESPYLPVDGELPWGTWSMNEDPDNPEAGWIINGPQTARRLFLQHYTSLSVIHNYKEKDTKDKYSMMYWKETPISEAFLIENKMPVSDNYFRKKDGSVVERNAFDYIRDHLGYRLELQTLTAPEKLIAGRPNRVEITLINRGFSTLFNEHQVNLVLIDDKDEVVHIIPTSSNVHDWQPYQPGDREYKPLIHTIRSEIQIPKELPKGKYRLGLWIPDASQELMMNNRFAIRCANGDIDWWVSPEGEYGINILTSINL